MNLAIKQMHITTLSPPAHHHHALARARALRATATDPMIDASDVALAFGAALGKAWRGESFAPLAALLLADASVETPLWSCKDRAAYESELKGAREFFSALSPPALTVLSHRTLADGRTQVSWILGVEWPAMWRPRVNLLGQSTLTLAPRGSGGSGGASAGDSGSSGGRGGVLVRRVEESWHQSPWEAFRSQVLPQFRDFASLWASPTAEQLPMQTIASRKGYELVRVPPMLALQSEWTESGMLLKSEQAPLPPAFAFTGEVKRRGWYNAVSPGFVERASVRQELGAGMAQAAQRRRWYAALPVRFGDEPSKLPRLPDPTTDPEYRDELPDGVTSVSVGYVRRPAQLLALRRLKQAPANNAVLSAALELAAAVEADGATVVRSEGRPLVVQMSGDLKYGFNDRAELAMSVWLSVPNAFKEEYVGVVVEEKKQ